MYEMDQYTVSLLHFDDGLKDECGKVWVSNNAGVSTDQKKFGNSSLAVDVGKYIYTDDVSDFDFTGQFTIEMWVMFTKYPTARGQSYAHNLFSQFKDSNNVINLDVGSFGDNSMSGIGFDSTSGGARIVVGGKCNLSLNTWYHTAFVADGLGGLYVFLNGKLISHENMAVKFPLLNSTRACIGKLLFPGSDYDCIGYIDEVRISKIARWTEEFTPPSEPDTPTPGTGEILLVITMAEEVEKEYQLSKSELDAFVSWYNNRSEGTGAPYYTFDKSFKRKDYLVFDKILTFEVTDFTK